MCSVVKEGVYDPDEQEDVRKNVSKFEIKSLKIVLGAYWCCAAAAKC